MVVAFVKKQAHNCMYKKNEIVGSKAGNKYYEHKYGKLDGSPLLPSSMSVGCLNKLANNRNITSNSNYGGY